MHNDLHFLFNFHLFPNLFFYYRALNEKNFTTINNIFLTAYLKKGVFFAAALDSASCFVLFLACTDKELRNLASRLKDWFGALHEDANRVIKPTSSETAQGSKKTPFPFEHCVL